MKFKPKTDKEIAEERLIPAGDYPFEISGAEHYISKAGNEMLKILVRVYKEDGSFLLVDDYLTEKIMYKVKHLCDATGLTDAYNAGELEPEALIGKTGELKLGIQVDKSGNYPDRNSIKDYKVPKDGEPKKALPKKDDDFGDSIPF